MIADTSHRGQSFILLGCSNHFFIKREASFLFLRQAFGGGTEKSQLSPTAANQPKKTLQAPAYRSSHHIVHERPEAPPVHRSVVTRPGQDLWSPARKQANTK